ncbi:outer membrane lipid asymmetry maintenance protein MlaD [bacterium]|jgi:phospholipid/cholesterol/gamma-HCH transport system substrate-binding protein|nr:outer membrane lipid asymmetry maintenance protein MlaD [bacterium]NBW56504.1 outer membrane lipid asymmetry maintenance protein MlaD [bacterium]NBX72583.1 outer membrane lipid asymmetry maintenance protein MlaD [bacterium]
MKEKTLYTAVGTLVIAGFCALLFLAVQVSGAGKFYHPDASYTVVAEFSNIGGLKNQAKVSIAGVTVGRVTSIHLDKNNFYAKVTLEIFDTYNQIPDDSRLSIVTAGLLGDNYLSFSAGFSDNYLKQNSYIDSSQTISAVVLEELISKLLTSMQAA